MGCNCKQIKKMQNYIPNANHKDYDKKGILGGIYKLFGSMANIGTKILFSIVLIIACPIVIILLIINLFREGNATIRVPKKALQAAMKK